jgi:ABC-2 type transport system permease protein
MRVPGQTVLSPLISTSLYFLVFGYSLSGRVNEVEGVPYLQFIVPGLVFLGLANNAFLNSSSSLFITKIQGTLVDLLVAPLGPLELLAGFIGGAMVRGLLVGGLTWLVASFFTGFHLEHAPATLLFLLLSSYTFSVLGILAAVWAEKFEQINFFPTFVMLPLTFLGGIFYSVRELPSPWNHISLFNPMVYMVEGLRYGMLGRGGFSPLLGSGILMAVALVSTGLAWAALRSGYKLKA